MAIKNLTSGSDCGCHTYVRRNYPELLIAFLAVTAAGGVAVPLNALWKSEELEYAIGDAGCKVRSNWLLWPAPQASGTL